MTDNGAKRRRVSGSGNFFDRLARRVAAVDSLLCVGLDPHQKELPGGVASVENVEAFCKRIIDATRDVAAAYKPNAAFFECLGDEGAACLARVIASIPDDIPVLLDVKRGDIGTTAQAYAQSSYDHLGADAVTLSPLMGYDSVEPFITAGHADKGAFVLCKTSNPGSNDLLAGSLSSGDRLFEKIANLAGVWGRRAVGEGATPNVGLVVGATDASAMAAARAAAPQLWILAPGVGFQGGSLEASCTAGLRSDGSGLLLPVSRGISKAESPGAAATDFRNQINAVRRKQADAKGANNDKLEQYQADFIRFAVGMRVLKFDAAGFKLKSGRMSPYFFNAGLFNTGSALAKLGKAYAQALAASSVGIDGFDVIFGPAYKGISLGAVFAAALSECFGRDVGFAYNRKEAKDHGEGGVLVGAEMKGKKVLIVDDVITAGTAIRESTDLLKKIGATPIGVIIAMDRQEKRSDTDTTSAVQAVQRDLGFPVVSIISLAQLVAFLAQGGSGYGDDVLQSISEYRKKYGVVE